ncbi:MAG: hypothetical protein AAGF77_11855 [Bacteroidota bacterium]
MKNWIISITLMVQISCCAGLWAQGPNQDRIRSFKVAFITEQLALTPQEAQQFWPVYNTHEIALQKLRKRERQQFGSPSQQNLDLSDAEATQLLEQFDRLQQEKHTLEQQFLKDLKTVLPPRKIVKLLKAERDFKKRLLQQVRKRGGRH